MAIDMSKFRVVKHVTRRLLKLQDNQPTYVQITDPIFQAEQSKKPKMVTGPDGSSIPVPPPFIVNVIDLSDGSPAQMVCNEVLKEELSKQYKDATYVGKYFELIKHTKAEGKNYNTFGITELAPAEDEVKAPAEDEVKAPATQEAPKSNKK